MPSYRGYRFPSEVISHAVWLYRRFSLSFRDVEDLLAERGITVTYETIRQWCRTFGPEYARRRRRRRGRPGDTWYLDELFVRMQGRTQYLWVYPGFPTLFWGLSVFFVGDLMGKALWKLVENAARFPRRGGRVLCVHGAVSFHRARPCGQDGSQGGGPCVMSSWTAASSDCSRPVNNYVHVKTADLYRPNARLTPERQGYQVLTPFGKLGYSRTCGGRLTRMGM